MKREFADAENILIIRLSSLGDVLLTLPVLTALKKKFPEKKFSYLVNKNYADAVKFHPAAEKLFTYEKTKHAESVETLLREQFDFTVDLQNNRRSRDVRNKLGLPFVKFEKPDLKKFLLVRFKINLFEKVEGIPLLYARALPTKLEISYDDFKFYLPEGEAKHSPDKKKICICPGAQHFTKRYPPEYFIRFGKELSANGFSIAVLGGKSDKEICSEIAGEIEGATDASTDDDLFALARELQTCAAAVCNDSGLMHLAAASGTPVTAIFGSSVKEFGFAPFTPKSLLLEINSLSCRPCSHVGREKCPKKHFRCMKEITPEYLLKQFLNFYENHV